MRPIQPIRENQKKTILDKQMDHLYRDLNKVVVTACNRDSRITPELHFNDRIDGQVVRVTNDHLKL